MSAFEIVMGEGEVLAHGIGGRSDLPVAPWLATYAGIVVVAVTFFAATALWSRPRWTGSAGQLRMVSLERVVDSPAFRCLLRGLGFAILAVFLIVGWLGPDDLGRMNPAPTWLYVWFWVGMVPASLLLGPVWRRVNPLRPSADAIRGVLRLELARLPDWVGMWPAVVSLAAFLWLELVYDGAASPRTVAWFVAGYSLVHITAGVVFGPRWFERGDGFEVYSTVIARASWVGRDNAGSLVLRNPMRGIAATPTSPSVTPVVVVVLGSTVFDGVSRSSWWASLISGTDRIEYLLLGTFGIAGAIAAVAASFGAAIRVTGRHLRHDVRPLLSALMGPSLIPIAIGYTVAHYVSFALFQGQQGYLLGNDPLGRGWDLLGLSDASIDYTILSASQIAFLQIGAIVLGHVVAVLSAHDRSLELTRPAADGMRKQYPLMLVMLLYTGVGVALLSGG